MLQFCLPHTSAALQVIYTNKDGEGTHAKMSLKKKKRTVNHGFSVLKIRFSSHFHRVTWYIITARSRLLFIIPRTYNDLAILFLPGVLFRKRVNITRGVTATLSAL